MVDFIGWDCGVIRTRLYIRRCLYGVVYRAMDILRQFRFHGGVLGSSS